ncbi:MAG: UDP-N-acetylglucosamine 1-carboxyvinyltransferase [Clostridia bacterium]|nr:UDP-N-acetylglucosamine 1-carboxyvinyltransferase [Clostridia bacterium]
MEFYRIQGGRRLQGAVRLQGAKNSALPILAATVAAGGKSVLHHCPQLTDIDATVAMLRHIGCRVTQDGETVTVDASAADSWEIPEHLMREMRSSIIFLGALIARFGRATVTQPGGCDIGLRPINLHLSALQAMGVRVEESGGQIRCSAPDGVRAAELPLALPSVGATENILLAALCAQGETVIRNAAREPEIGDLASFLRACGADITGDGESTVRIRGGRALHDAAFTIMPDRIAAATYMVCAACTGGSIEIAPVIPEHLSPVLPVFREAGCDVRLQGQTLCMTAPARLTRVRSVQTMPYPGFPTDAQAVVMAMLATAQGTSVITEKVFENRFHHIPELRKMGADIRTADCGVAVIEGVPRLHGAAVTASDLRGGSALVAAALGAEGETTVARIAHIDRGCERFAQVLRGLGADIEREQE